MENEFLEDLDKTATFFVPLEYNSHRYIKNNGKFYDFQLKVLGRQIAQLKVQQSYNSDLENDKRASSSTIQTAQSTPPQKFSLQSRQISDLHIQFEDKEICSAQNLNRNQSSKTHKRNSFEPPLHVMERLDSKMVFGEYSAHKIINEQQFRKSGRRFIPKLKEQEEKTILQQTFRSKLLTLKTNSPSSAYTRNKLPDIFQTPQVNQTVNIQKQYDPTVKKKTSSISFRVLNQYHSKAIMKEITEGPQSVNLNRQEPSSAQSTTQNFFSNQFKLPHVSKSKPFLQRKAQTQIIDRIFSGRSQT